MSTTDLSKIPTLQGSTNYQEWSMEIKATTQLGKFWRVFTGQNSPVDDTATAKENAMNREEAALGLIGKTVIKTIARDLNSFADPKDSSKTIKNRTTQQLWDYLEHQYSTKEGITSFHKFGALFRSELVDNGTLKIQINKLSDMRSVCVMNEFDLKDWQFAVLVLHMLPTSYSHLPNNLITAGKIKDLKFSEVHTKILEAKSLRKGDTSANLLTLKKPGNKGKKLDRTGKPPSPCKFCQGNHWNDQCKKLKLSSTQPNTASANKPDKTKPGSSLHVLDHSDYKSDAPVSCYIGSNASLELWLMDSGATDHMTPYGSDFNEYATLVNSNNRVILGDSRTKLEILGKGNIHHWVEIMPGIHRELLLKNVLHVKGLKQRFLSTSCFTDSGFTVAFSGNNIAITKGKFRISGIHSSPFFMCLLYLDDPSKVKTLNAVTVKALPIELWHQRMGHANWDTIKQVRSDNPPSMESNSIHPDLLNMSAKQLW